jgi:hypothetical protein
MPDHQCSLPDRNLEQKKHKKILGADDRLGVICTFPIQSQLLFSLFRCCPTAVKTPGLDAESPGVSGERFIKAGGPLLGEKSGNEIFFWLEKILPKK